MTLYRLADDGRPIRMTQALTDDDGRVRDLLERPLTAGDYRLEFGLGRGGFFERLSLDLHVTDATRSYHVPLLHERLLADDLPRQLTARTARERRDGRDRLAVTDRAHRSGHGSRRTARHR